MTTQYTPILKLALPVTGELSGTWGDVVNDNITSMVEQAIAGLATISTWSANAHTLSTANGTTSESRCAMLVAQDGAGLAASGEIVCPASSKLYVLKNATSYQITLKTASGTGVAVASGETAFLFCDGTNVNACVTTIINGHITGNLTVDGNATVNGNTTLGNATSDTITATARFASGLIPSADNTYDLGSTANSWKDLYIDGTAYLALVDINGGTIDGVSIGATTPATFLAVDNLSLDGNTIASTNTNGNIVIAPNGTGDVQLDADTVRVGDSGAAATLTSNGAGALTVTTGGAADLTLSTNSGTTSGTITIANGANGNITLTPNGTGDVILSADTTQIGDSNTDAYLTTNGTGNLNLTTNNGTNSGTIQIAQGANGNITLTPNGTGSVSVPKLVWSNGTATRVPYLTTGGQFTDDADMTFDGTTLTVGGLSTAGSVTLSGGTANGVVYLNGSKVATTGSALTFDGTTFTTTGSGGIYLGTNNTYVSGKQTGGSLRALLGIDASDYTFNGAYSGFTWNIQGAENMRLTTSGLMVGTTTALGKVTVSGSDTAAIKISAKNTNTDAVLEMITGGTAAYAITSWQYAGVLEGTSGNGTSNALVLSAYNGPLVFQTNSRTYAGSFDSSGYLLLGISSGPGYRLAVKDDIAIYTSNDSAGATNLRLGSSASMPQGIASVTGAKTAVGSGILTFGTASGGVLSEVARFLEAGNFVIGGTSTTAKFQVFGNGTVSTTDFYGSTFTTKLQAASGTSVQASLAIMARGPGGANSGVSIHAVKSATSDDYRASMVNTITGDGIGQSYWAVNNFNPTGSSTSELMRLTYNGFLGVGTTPAVVFDAYSASGGIIRVKGGTSNNEGGAFYVQKAGDTNTLSAFGDWARINGGTPDQATAVYTFGTTPLIFAVGTERARITTGGSMKIGASNAGGRFLGISDGATDAADYGTVQIVKPLDHDGSWGYACVQNGLDIAGMGFADNSSGSFVIGRGSNPATTNSIVFNNGPTTVFNVNGSERARIDSGGVWRVANTSTPSGCTGFGGEVSVIGNSSNASLFYTTGSANTGVPVSSARQNDGPGMYFFRNGSAAGYIQVTTGAISLNNSSDYRLKENVISLTGSLAKILQVRPVIFDWKENGAKGKSVIAHELQEVFPDAVFGEKDAVNKDGSIKPQSVALGNLIPDLIVAIQELKSEFDAYKATHP